MPAIDGHVDPQIAAVANLLAGVIRAEFGSEALAQVHTWPLQLGLVPATRFPCLAVYVANERQEKSDHEDDFRTVTLRVDYYAPLTPIDRIEARWPLLRKVWTLCLSRLRVGWDPRVSAGAKLMRLAGFEVPGPTTGMVTYETAPADTANVIPSFSGSVTIGVGQDFDWSAFELDDLEGIDTTSTIDGASGFESETNFD